MLTQCAKCDWIGEESDTLGKHGNACPACGMDDFVDPQCEKCGSYDRLLLTPYEKVLCHDCIPKGEY